MSVQVTVEQGTLQGKQCVSCDGRQFYSFLGVPYARPPLGSLRFRNPQKPDSWSGVRDATRPGNKCVQANPLGGAEINGSEDCLYLNVHTPSLPAEKIQKLPVIFFIHGGRFLLGYGDYYNPDYFIRNDVIVVTVNYRLHILGFLCLNIPEVPGNAGPKDTVMALRWVNKNISKFNGDENNVTVMGESAGGGIASTYLFSKMTDGLFHKVIPQSSSCLSDLYMLDTNPVDNARKIASYLDKDFENVYDLYNFLIDAPMEELLFAYNMAEISRPWYEVNCFLLPVVEKEFEGVERFIHEYPLISLKKNQFKKLPILTGLNSHEGALFLRYDDGNIVYENYLQHFLPRYLKIPYDSPKAARYANFLRQFYFQGKNIDGMKEEYINFLSDTYFNRDVLYFVELYSRLCRNLYVYRFNYSGGMHTRVLRGLGLRGATHGDMIQYQFYKSQKAAAASAEDLAVVKLLSDAWCAFARTSKPSLPNHPTKWLPYTNGERNTLVIDDYEHVKMVKNLDRERYLLWEKILIDRSKL